MKTRIDVKSVLIGVGRTGTANDGSLQAFIPDKGSDRTHHWFRNTSKGDTEWHDLAAMNKVE